MFNNISYRTLNILKYSVTGLAFAVSAFLLAYLLSKQMTNISQSIHTYNNISAQRQSRIDFSSQLAKDIEKIGAANEAKLQTALVIDEDISDIVQIINNLAAKYSSNHTFPNIGGITRVSQVAGLNISSIDYSFQMTANIDSVIKYLKELEGNKNFISTTSFNILGDNRTGWDGTSTVNMVGKIYFRSTNQ